jgi:hypothetical protein
LFERNPAGQNLHTVADFVFEYFPAAQVSHPEERWKK